MRLISRSVFREIALNALLGTMLFTFVLFLQQISRLFALLVRSTAPPTTVGSLFLLILPSVLTFTIPVGVLVGTLIGLTRMSADSEITALRASGYSARRLFGPVMMWALIGTIITGAATLYLTPWAIRQRYKLLTKLAAAQLTAEIQPRVFEEQFPNRVLFVKDVIAGQVIRWKNIFIADISPPETRAVGGEEAGSGPRITTAAEAIAVPDVARNRIQLSLVNGTTHTAGKNPAEYYNTYFPAGEQVLEAEKQSDLRPRLITTEMPTSQLWVESATALDARIELHWRFALPPACLFFALLGLSMGTSTRKGGKSGAYVITVCVAFLYWMSFTSLFGLAKSGTLPAGVALWIPNLMVGIVGLYLFAILEKPGDRDIVGAIIGFFRSTWQNITGSLSAPSAVAPSFTHRFLFVPALVDRYILSSFLFYFVLLLSSFVLMTEVYNFFELLSDIVKNRIPMSTVTNYLFFLTPQLIYSSAPMSVQVAVLVTFGLLTKNNEVTALKATGVSLYRLAIPVMIAAIVLSGALFAFDHFVVPQANLVQDRLRNEIRAKPVQTYLRPDRKWIMGGDSRIFFYKYFDPQGVMVDVNVYELDPATFQLNRHIAADRARWEPALNQWIFQNGWSRTIRQGRVTNYAPFLGGTAMFGEIRETPSWFLKEELQDKQMNFRQLAAYINDLKQSGLDTVRLQVQFYKKFSAPVFAFVMALLAIPFAFLSGHRGAMAGIGVSFGIAIAYWSVNLFFEQIGNVNQLPPYLAAWSPNAVFSLAGLYMLARMRT
ncbi:MAG TPA: LptF/LptG family permease [Bryobacteraceae bacterium]|nr:LptF/LptG family permease [Bryobacteraceae bacterium]